MFVLFPKDQQMFSVIRQLNEKPYFCYSKFYKTMTTHQQILKDTNGNDIGVFLPIKDYNAIMELLEDMEDVRDFELAKARNEEKIPLREAINQRKNSNG